MATLIEHRSVTSGADHGVETFLVAIMGVDGCGKTAILAELQRRDALEGAVYVPPNAFQCDSLLRRYFRPAADGTLDFVEGGFARIRPFATAMDVLHHYDAHIRPLFDTVPFVAVERYVLSAMAYLAAMGHQTIMHDYFANVRRADLTIYLRADTKTLAARYEARGGWQDDEAPELIRRHAAALDELVANTDWPVATVDSSRPIEIVYPEVECIIKSAVAERRAGRLTHRAVP